MRPSSAATCFKSDEASLAHQPFRRALTLTEVIIVATVALFLFSIFIFTLPKMRRPAVSYRTACSSNLKQLGTAMYTYANENNEMWAISPHAEAVEEGVGRVSYAPGKIGLKRGSTTRPADGESTTADTELSVTRSMWLLVRANAAVPMQFICPDDPTAQPNNDDNPQDFWDFSKYTETSYGFQVPYGKKGQPADDRDQRMPLAADKGPFGAVLEAGAAHPGVPSVAANANPDQWMKWNSPNHGGEGQVVLYADSHADFQTKPTAGIDQDNIYSRWSRDAGYIKANESARVWGVPPTGRETPWSDTDSLIYP